MKTTKGKQTEIAQDPTRCRNGGGDFDSQKCRNSSLAKLILFGQPVLQINKRQDAKFITDLQLRC